MRKVRIGKRFFTFLFFLLIALLFWFLNALGREYTAAIDYPVRFANFPENRKLVSEAPDDLTVIMTGYGYNLLKYKLNLSIDPYRINLKKYPLKQRSSEDSVTFYLLTNVIRNRLAATMNAENKIEDVQPDTVFLKLARMRKKVVPVHLHLDVDYAQQYRKKGKIHVEPDSIVISGPENIVDTISAVHNKSLKLSHVDQSQKIYLDLIGHEDLVYSDDNIRINIPVGRFTEKKIPVNVNKRDVPDSLKLILFPGSVNVSFMVCLEDYDKIDSSFFKAVVNYDGLFGEKDKLDVQLVEKPSYVYNVRLNPSKVEYILESKE